MVWVFTIVFIFYRLFPVFLGRFSRKVSCRRFSVCVKTAIVNVCFLCLQQLKKLIYFALSFGCVRDLVCTSVQDSELVCIYE